jgi:hypothetical protein
MMNIFICIAEAQRESTIGQAQQMQILYKRSFISWSHHF